MALEGLKSEGEIAQTKRKVEARNPDNMNQNYDEIEGVTEEEANDYLEKKLGEIGYDSTKEHEALQEDPNITLIEQRLADIENDYQTISTASDRDSKRAAIELIVDGIGENVKFTMGKGPVPVEGYLNGVLGLKVRPAHLIDPNSKIIKEGDTYIIKGPSGARCVISLEIPNEIHPDDKKVVFSSGILELTEKRK